MGRGWKNFEQNDRKHRYCYEQTVSRNVDINDFITEDSEGSEDSGREKSTPS